MTGIIVGFMVVLVWILLGSLCYGIAETTGSFEDMSGKKHRRWFVALVACGPFSIVPLIVIGLYSMYKDIE
jgi:EamA domain-containing membrane protein RarD